MKKCPECNKIVADNLTSCDNCGYPFDGVEQIIPEVVKNESQRLEAQINISVTNSEEIDEVKHESGNAQEVATQVTENIKAMTSKIKIIRNILLVIGCICFIIGSCFLKTGFSKKNKYYNSEYSSITENAYVGGDAYNYIINGTYFTGYLTLASGMYVVTGITVTAGLCLIAIEEKGKHKTE